MAFTLIPESELMLLLFRHHLGFVSGFCVWMFCVWMRGLDLENGVAGFGWKEHGHGNKAWASQL